MPHMRGPDVYRNILAAVALGGSVVACGHQDIPTQTTPPDKGPGVVTLKTPDKSPLAVTEAPRPGWIEYMSLIKLNRLVLDFQLPANWSYIDQDQQILAESEQSKDPSQIQSVLIITRPNSYESDTFAKSIADERGVKNKNERSSLNLKVNGKEVLSFVKRNETTHYQEDIFGFTINGVGVTIIINSYTGKIGELKPFTDTFGVISFPR